MVYVITLPRQLPYLSNAWCDTSAIINLCNMALANQFQTQNARTTTQQQFGDLWTTVVSAASRFPATGFYVYRYDPILEQLITALMNSFDTRNRIIETENNPTPSTTEVVNATQRVDDATVNIRSCITNLLNPLLKGDGVYNQSTFESTSGLSWTTAP
ncbi:MAG: putative coat protein [Yunnan virgavirus 3]|nr:MAG: putative coat protein [Yunnan virgavirus 3]